MTSRNSLLKARPFLLKPAGKDYLWGGNRLNEYFAKGIDMAPLAETWECSTHPDGPSIVASGIFSGQTLSKVIKEHPEYIGSHPKSQGELPILIKFIDAKKNLSVQVHPSDEYAKANEDGQLGKNEMWYVLDAEKESEIVYGFRQNVTKEQVRAGIECNTIENYLQKVKIKKDDVFYIKAGTVHAIGEGSLIAEIQESSNLTYRLYDYNRLDKNGLKRELHIDKALEVANLQSSIEPRQPMRVLKYKRGCASELLCKCKYFEVERLLINTEEYVKGHAFQTYNNSFQVLLCIDGHGVITDEKGEDIIFIKGDCVFVPADSVPLRLHGTAQLLKVCC